MNPQTIQARSSDLEAAKAKVSQLEALLSSHGAVSATSADGLPAARSAYEDAVAARALGEVGDAEVTAAQQALIAAETRQREIAEQGRQDAAVIAGIQRRLELARGAQQAASVALTDAQDAWALSELERADAAYVEAATAAASAAARVETLKDFLQSRGHRLRLPQPWLNSVRLPPLASVSLRASQEAHPKFANANPPRWDLPVAAFSEPAAGLDVVKHELELLGQGKATSFVSIIKSGLSQLVGAPK